MIRCGGSCAELVECPNDGLPPNWRYVLSRDPNAPRVEISFDADSPFQVDGPPDGPYVAMCSPCAALADAAAFN